MLYLPCKIPSASAMYDHESANMVSRLDHIMNIVTARFSPSSTAVAYGAFSMRSMANPDLVLNEWSGCSVRVSLNGCTKMMKKQSTYGIRPQGTVLLCQVRSPSLSSSVVLPGEGTFVIKR